MLIRAALVAALVLVCSSAALPAVAGADGGPSSTPTAAVGDSPPPQEEAKDKKAWWEELEAFLKSFLTIAGLLAGFVLVVGGGLAVAWVMNGRRNASLMIEPFGDGGVEPKVGAVMTGLIQKRLAELSDERRRQSKGKGSYRTDLFVHADLALLSRSESLQTALAGLGDASQFKLAVALVSLIDRRAGNHLTAKGELAPLGKDGYGVVLSLQSEKDGIEANGSLWDGSAPAAPPPPDAPTGDAAPTSSEAKPYYELADRSAAWIQYQAARALDKTEVSLMTKSPTSFGLVSEAAVRAHAGDLEGAAELYLEALAIDAENVAALINLSALLAGHYKLYEPAVKLLGLARIALRSRYRVAEERQQGDE